MKIPDKLKDFKLDRAKHKWYIIFSVVLLLAIVSAIITYAVISDDGKNEGFAEIPPIKFYLSKTIHGKISIYGRKNENAYIIMSNKNGKFFNEVLSSENSIMEISYTSGLQKLKINFLLLTPPLNSSNKGFIILDCEYSDENGLDNYYFSEKIAEW